MTNESPFRKNRAFYIGVVLTVLEGILSGCSYLSVYIVLTALASGTITAGMVGAVTAGLAVIFLLRLVIYSTGYTQVQIGGAAVSKRLRLLLGDKDVYKRQLPYLRLSGSGTKPCSAMAPAYCSSNTLQLYILTRLLHLNRPNPYPDQPHERGTPCICDRQGVCCYLVSIY